MQKPHGSVPMGRRCVGVAGNQAGADALDGPRRIVSAASVPARRTGWR
ncbi:hypothetical protein ASZ90_002346 [hydrocarbon metagenome]|uniref:Uncharacterized protein n=1 Tax=hydrocarbon metagenome TaxID=938273 RepID=A0A0W8G3N6_9ZZZZ